MDTVAVTDHGNMFGAIDFYTKAKAAGVKPIFGCETYVAGDRSPRPHEPPQLPPHPAREERGRLQEPAYLNSKGYLEGFYYNPRIDKQILREHSEGLDRPLGVPRRRGRADAREERRRGGRGGRAASTRAMFAPGRLLPRADADGDARAGHAQRRAQADEQEARHPARRDQRLPLRQPQRRRGARGADGIQTGKSLKDEKRLKHVVDSYYMKSPAEMDAAFKDVREAIENTAKIAEQCNVKLKLDKTTCRSTRCPTARRSTATSRSSSTKGLERRFREFAERGITFDPRRSTASAARSSSASSRRWASRATS